MFYKNVMGGRVSNLKMSILFFKLIIKYSNSTISIPKFDDGKTVLWGEARLRSVLFVILEYFHNFLIVCLFFCKIRDLEVHVFSRPKTIFRKF